ncbi:prepilin-type N-terminal cleavage/methylation domain-containing protein [Photobacterium satsumensis]|uniref:prepilin-type N-terminal cleavage/methylation domain-containing protein n=1 Tax=Photobacterium satsumensis TaxID=2910239 RepID=UPI003D132A79
MVFAQVVNRGFSLVELLVATAISLLVLASVTSVFISGFNSASQRSLQLMLAQDTNDALRMIKDDILRAGFASGASSTFVISGATKTVYLDSPVAGKSSCIGYGYNDGSEKHYRSYYLKDKKLNVFMTKSSVIDISGTCKNGHSILDYTQLKVTKFEIAEKILNAGTATSQLLTIQLDVSTLDDEFSLSKNVKVKTRNWY